LRDPNEFVRAAIINALANLGPVAAEALPALMERLEDPDAFVRSRTIIALTAIAGESAEVTAALAQAVKDRDPAVATEAMNALISLAAGGMVQPLADIVANPKVRELATRHLAKAEPESLRVLLNVARAAKGEAQAILLGLLTETMKSVGTVEGYKQDLTSVDPAIRAAALEALSLFGTEAAARIVAEVLKNDPVPAVRQRAAMILGRIPGEVSQSALRYAAEHDFDPEIRETARDQIVLTP
jgi:HEAT repeat protein